MSGKKAMRKAPQLHLAMMVSVCAVLAGCETTGKQASAPSKTQHQISGKPQLAAPGTAVAQLQLPATPPETLYPVAVAYEPAVDPVLAAEAVDPAQIPGLVPVPRPSPMTAFAMVVPVAGAPSGDAVAALQSAAGQPAPQGLEAQAQTFAATTTIPASPLAQKGARPGMAQPAPVNVASAAGLPASVMLAEQIAPQSAVPTPRPGPLGYAAPGGASSALAAINSTVGDRMDPTGADRDRIDGLIARYSREYGVPEQLIHRVVHRESRYNPKAFNKRGYFGLMQIAYPTARSMGYDGPPSGLLDAETNLKYAIKYLRGAYVTADNNHDNAVRLYARGYYYDAKRKGVLETLK